MADEVPEYLVETVTQARVSRKVKGKLYWKYFVKWKGYGREENTWEPPGSFKDGSEHFLAHFWERVNIGGRDYNDASQFKVGEEVFPTGPPRRKKKLPEKGEDADAGPPSSAQDGQLVEGDKTDTRMVSKQKRRRSSVSPEIDSPIKPKRLRASQGSSDVNKTPSSRSPRGQRRASQNHASEDPNTATSTPTTTNRRPSSSRFRQRSPSSDVPPSVPGEDDEEEQLFSAELQYPPTDNDAEGITDRSSPSPSMADLFGNEEGDSSRISSELASTGSSSTIQTGLKLMPSGSALPSHRAREANPLVRLADDPSVGRGLGSAISVKAKISGKAALTPSSSTGGPSEGASSSNIKTPSPRKRLQTQKSSLLTFHKGSLRTVKGKYVREQVNGDRLSDDGRVPNTIGNTLDRYDQALDFGADADGDTEMNEGNEGVPPFGVDAAGFTRPTGEQLLKAAGLIDEDAEALPDFEDVDADADQQESSNQNESTVTRDGSATESTFAPLLKGISAMWRHSTIFGPLGLGADTTLGTPVKDSTDTPSSSTRPFLLSINPEIAIRITFKDVNPGSSSNSPTLAAVVAKCESRRGPPGKLYQDSILDTVKTGGSSARVALDAEADETQKYNFEQFCKRLESGNLFIVVAGDSVLAFCSSENKTLAQKLGVPSQLVGLRDTLLVSYVVIEDYSAYADLAIQAENVRL